MVVNHMRSVPANKLVRSYTTCMLCVLHQQDPIAEHFRVPVTNVREISCMVRGWQTDKRLA